MSRIVESLYEKYNLNEAFNDDVGSCIQKFTETFKKAMSDALNHTGAIKINDADFRSNAILESISYLIMAINILEERISELEGNE